MAHYLKPVGHKIFRTLPSHSGTRRAPLHSCPSCSIVPTGPPVPISHYSYQPLATPTSTRVFELLPGSQEEAIRGALHEFDLQVNNRPYLALSYTWGNNARHHAITCDSGRLMVTCNLNSALLRLRKKEESVILFIDCICINQSVDERSLCERAAQVQMMDRIFGGAAAVVVDLGDEFDNSSWVVDLIKHLAALAEDTFPELVVGSFAPVVADIIPHPGIPASDDPLWHDIVSFTRRRWFERLWVVQEYALARELRFLIGIRENCFQPGLRELHIGIRRLMIHISPERHPNETDPKTGRQILITQALQDFRLRIEAMEKARKGCLAQNAGTERPPLVTLLDWTKAFEVADQHDRVYAVLGMSKYRQSTTPFLVDYAESLPSLSRRLTNFLIDQNEFIELLTSQAAMHAGSAASWMIDLTLAVSNTVNVQEKGFWVPPDNCYQSRNLGRACGHTVMSYHKPADENLIILSGSFIGEIEEVSDVAPNLTKHHHLFMATVELVAQFHELMRWDRKVIEMVSRHLPNATRNDLKSACRTTMVARGTKACLINHDEFEEAAKAYDVLVTWTSVRQWVRHGSQFEEVDGPIWNDEQQLSAKFAINMAMNCTDRRFCITREKRFGLVPAEAKVGDKIAILLGCPLPFILRKKGDHYRLISVSYIQGMMQGEALESSEWDVAGIVLC